MLPAKTMRRLLPLLFSIKAELVAPLPRVAVTDEIVGALYASVVRVVLDVAVNPLESVTVTATEYDAAALLGKVNVILALELLVVTVRDVPP